MENAGRCSAAPRDCTYSAASANGCGSSGSAAVSPSPPSSARNAGRSSPSFGRLGLDRLHIGRAQRLRDPARARQQPLGFPRHVGLLEMVDQLHRRFALGFPHRFEDARLRHPAEIILDRRRPAGRRHVEVHRAGQRIGMVDAPRTAVPRFVRGVDAERGAMRQQRGATVGIEPHQRVPQIVFRAWASCAAQCW